MQPLARLNSGADFANLAHRRHTGHPAITADIRWHAFQSHNGASARSFGNNGLFGVDDVHNDAAFEHFGQSALNANGSSGVGVSHGVSLGGR